MLVQPLLGGSSVLAVVALDVQTLDVNILDVFFQVVLAGSGVGTLGTAVGSVT